MFKKQIDFRHNPRHEVHLSVEFTGDQVSGKGLVCNLSRSGCCIKGHTRVPVGAFVELKISLPDGLALDVNGNLYVCCYASDEIWRINPQREKSLLAHDRWGILLGRPTNLAFGGKNFDEIYVANLGRYTITRAPLGARGRPPANLAPAP